LQKRKRKMVGRTTSLVLFYLLVLGQGERGYGGEGEGRRVARMFYPSTISGWLGE
jgi:hypothetical protein